MKAIQFLFFAALGSLLMAADCSNKDSEFYNDVFVTTPGLVDIETQSSYGVDDVLWINTNNFSRYIDEPAQASALDVYKTTGGATAFNFTYVLERRIADDNWALVSLGNNLIQDQGIAQETEFFVSGLAIYDATNQVYSFRSGMKLTQTGDYRLSFGYNSSTKKAVELRSESINNHLFLNITSPNTDLAATGYYSFTVN